jgi:GLPGLI family protein
MKFSTTAFLILISAFCISQNSVRVDYIYFNGLLDLKYSLYADNYKSIYKKIAEEVEVKNNILKAESTESDIQEIVVGSKITQSSMFANNESNTFFYTSELENKLVLVKDIVPSIKWRILDSQKDILGYNCTKAVAEFRGSKIFAWFADDIPISFGPWKFKGLPGLILEAGNTSGINTILWRATRIAKTNQEGIDPIPELPIVSQEQKVKVREKNIEEKIKASNARLPKGVNVVSSKQQRGGIEQIYEWEGTKTDK